MYHTTTLLALSLLSAVRGQQIGTSQAEVHPSLQVATCTKAGGCVTKTQSIVLDGNWRWLHNTGGYTNCYTGNTWDKTLCPDPVTCAQNCAMDGASYQATYGISTSGNALTLDFVTASNVGSRVYLLASNTEYQLLSLINQEFTFDVDMSHLPCGVNGAVYFSQMLADGGVAAYPNNKAGAQYGTGYCDSQCPHDIKFIDGEANLLNWTGSSSTSGSGQYGTCCAEMDIWEANQYAAAYTPHPCAGTGPTRCSGTDCGDGDERYDGVCDKDGCDFNSWRMGDQTFLGPGLTVDTTKKFTIVTQFISDDGTTNGNLAAIKRFYVQNNVIIPNSYTSVPGIDPVNDITDAFCAQQKTVFDNQNKFATVGGLAKMGASIKAGMVLALSIWDDYAAYLLWLDSIYPVGADPSGPGDNRGPCPTNSGVPPTLEASDPGAYVVYSNIKWGELNSTFTGTLTSSSSSVSHSSTSSSSSSKSTSSSSTSKTTSTMSTSTSTSSSSSSKSSSTSSSTTSSPSATATGVASHWGQCGGIGWTGPTACASPYTCTPQNNNPYYSQCL